ncbi:MAG: hypothetical protein JW881_04270 [Spirochaetales bacterium]|nr:hypothetical protein [Spirochaetales bacterium]
MGNAETDMKKRIMDYRQSGIGYDSLLRDLCLEAYSYPKNKMRLSRDDCADFFLYVFPKIHSMITTYRDQGKPFEYYFNSVLHWKLKSFLRAKQSRQNDPDPVIDDHQWGQEAGRQSCKTILSLFTENSRIAGVFHIDKNGRIKKKSARKQMLFIILKHAKDISPEDADHIAHITGYNARWIFWAAYTLNESLTSNLRRHAFLRERQNNTFFRISCLEERLRYEVNHENRLRIKQKVAVLRFRMNNTMKRMSRIRLYPSNKDMAKVLGFSKGTIDSSISSLKTRLKKLYHDKKIKYA